MGGYRLALALSAALAVITTGTASARQAGYVFMQCDYTGADAGTPPMQLRIGNGRWDVLGDGAWRNASPSDCGTDVTDANGTSQTRCTFGENEYRMVISFFARYTQITTQTIDRVTGRYQYRWGFADGVGDVHEKTAQCRPIVEPKTAQRIF